VSGLADLHRHLDGSLRRATLDELARAAGVRVPGDLRFTANMGLEAALACFAATLSTLQSAANVERVASEICEDAASEGVTTLEIRFAPQLHKAASMHRIVDAALSGVGGRAGLILCGLYGEPPDLLDALVAIAEPREGVVGIDLAGGPMPDAEWRMHDYAAPFARAKRAGIGVTVHASEGRPPAEIRTAIEVLGADRIGHATTLLDDPSVVELVLARGVTIEACPTSNVHTGCFAAIEDHPLARWLDLGIKACVNTDNTLLSDVDAREEHRRASFITGMDDIKLARAIAFGHAARFARA
jgi:adenosine deaminase